jgi:hypothetical protein
MAAPNAHGVDSKNAPINPSFKAIRMIGSALNRSAAPHMPHSGHVQRDVA